MAVNLKSNHDLILRATRTAREPARTPSTEPPATQEYLHLSRASIRRVNHKRAPNTLSLISPTPSLPIFSDIIPGVVRPYEVPSCEGTVKMPATSTRRTQAAEQFVAVTKANRDSAQAVGDLSPFIFLSLFPFPFAAPRSAPEYHYRRALSHRMADGVLFRPDTDGPSILALHVHALTVGRNATVPEEQ